MRQRVLGQYITRRLLKVQVGPVRGPCHLHYVKHEVQDHRISFFQSDVSLVRFRWFRLPFFSVFF